MNKIRYVFSIAALAIVGVASAQTSEYVPGELLIKFVPGQGAALNQAIGATVKGYNSAIGVTTVKLPAGANMNAALNYYRSKTGVVYANFNHIARAFFVPNDPRFSQMYGPQKIQCIPGWDHMMGSPNVKIAILDSGIDLQHEDLAAKTTAGWDFVNNDNDPDDDNGHGTHCAGSASAITNNGIGVAGVAPNCSLLAVKVLSGGGSGSYEWINNGITFAADNGAHVISMSLGGGFEDPAQRDAIRYAISKGCVVIAAAGNHGTTQKFWPAGFDEVIAVASTNQNDQRAGSSAYGDWVDVAAPGVNILSTFPDNSYGFSSGTSMACPHVAGLAGLIKSAWPTATPAQIRAQIENNCDYVGNFVVKGRINVLRSVPVTFTTNPYTMHVQAIEMFEGKQAYNTINQARASDNTYYAVTSKMVERLGHVASMKATYVSAHSLSNLQQVKIKVEASAANFVTGSIFVWNLQSNSWQYLAASPLTGGDSVKEVALPAPYSRYFDSNRKLVVLYRGLMPVSPTRAAVQFPLRADLIQVNARIPK